MPRSKLAIESLAARGGVLVKGGAHRESLGLVRAIAVDKTGTITEGKPQVQWIEVVGRISGPEILRVSRHQFASFASTAMDETANF